VGGYVGVCVDDWIVLWEGGSMGSWVDEWVRACVCGYLTVWKAGGTNISGWVDGW
jgi:hypothetical protein